MADFKETVEQYFRKSLELSPVWGSDLGLEEYDDLLPEGGKKQQERSIALSESFLRDVKAFPESDLSFDERIDRECLIDVLEMDLFSEKHIKLDKGYPRGPARVGSALYTLISRDSTPFEGRLRSIISRLEKIPRYLEETRELVEKPVWIWTEIGIESCHRMKGYIDFIEEMAKALIKNDGLLRELHGNAVKVRDAFKAYEQWLSTDILPKAGPDYAIGEEKFAALMAMRKLGYTPGEILAIGEDYVKSINDTMKSIARQIDGTATVEEILKGIRGKGPTNFEQVLNDVKKVMREAREFVKESSFATLPENEILDVQETPIFMRHFIPFAAYSSPGKFDKIQKGIYMITPVEGNNERLKEFCSEDMVNTSVHEGYPGHHLQLCCSNTNPQTARIFAHAFEFIEGWAHYCEDAAAEAGFKNTPEGSLIRYKDMLWRAWRIIIDIKLSSGQMSFEDAIATLVNEVGMEEVGAMAEVKRYTYTPGYQLSYLMGKHMLKALKTRIKATFPRQFSDRRFHDILLYSGNLPIYLMEKVMKEKMGEKDSAASLPAGPR
ncbi:MAG: DUF885 domain-containing protein [Candidatus Eremiobacteraeota bacterium]|nr:DUF885 domain-containing protein [Candidatus Eremiobacteraeota bacterium]